MIQVIFPGGTVAEGISHFDCDAVIGRPRAPLPNVEPGVEDLLAEMARLGVSKALVRHRACSEVGPETGNELVLAQTAGRDELAPVWMLTPDSFLEPGGAQAGTGRMLDSGVAAAWMHPAGQDYVLEPWCCRRVLTALAERRVPLIVEWENVTGRQLHEVLAAFPRLPLVLLRSPRMGRNRTLYALLEEHENLHVAVTPTYSVYRGIEDLCGRFGPSRFLFGTGYPEVEGGAAVCMLSYAQISEQDRLAIASGNLERLLREVER